MFIILLAKTDFWFLVCLDCLVPEAGLCYLGSNTFDIMEKVLLFYFSFSITTDCEFIDSMSNWPDA